MLTHNIILPMKITLSPPTTGNNIVVLTKQDQ